MLKTDNGKKNLIRNRSQISYRCISTLKGHGKKLSQWSHVRAGPFFLFKRNWILNCPMNIDPQLSEKCVCNLENAQRYCDRWQFLVTPPSHLPDISSGFSPGSNFVCLNEMRDDSTPLVQMWRPLHFTNPLTQLIRYQACPASLFFFLILRSPTHPRLYTHAHTQTYTWPRPSLEMFEHLSSACLCDQG